jgi:hypothetical protein
MISGSDADLQILGLVPGAYDALAGMASAYGGIGMASGYAGIGRTIGAPMHPMAHMVPHHAAIHPALAHAVTQGIQHPIARLAPSHPGTPQPGGRWWYFPLLASAFTATSGTSLNFAQSPQHYFKGRRWVYVETRTGASATGIVNVFNPAVGTHIQLLQAGASPAAQYAPGAYDTDESIDPCGPGVVISGSLQISAAPTSTDRVDFSFGCKGEALG